MKPTNHLLNPLKIRLSQNHLFLLFRTRNKEIIFYESKKKKKLLLKLVVIPKILIFNYADRREVFLRSVFSCYLFSFAGLVSSKGNQSKLCRYPFGPVKKKSTKLTIVFNMLRYTSPFFHYKSNNRTA